MCSECQKEILRIKSEMNEEHMSEIIAIEDQIDKNAERAANDMQTKHEQEILRIKSEMNEEHKREIIAKDDEIATLLSQNQQLQV